MYVSMFVRIHTYSYSKYVEFGALWTLRLKQEFDKFCLEVLAHLGASDWGLAVAITPLLVLAVESPRACASSCASACERQ